MVLVMAIRNSALLWVLRSRSSSISADVCSACHPFYTGKQKILDTGGRVARFEQRFGKRSK